MRQKNIAVLMTALDSDSQTEMLKGIEKYGKSHGYNIAVFLWSVGSMEEEKQYLGEVNIVYLPDLNLFDGIILFANALHIESNRKRIEEVLENVTCPIVSIGCKVKNSISVCTDNYSAMRTLMKHLVVDKKLSKIHFVKGIEGNPDGEARYQAYVDVLKEHGIPIVPERISQGDFYVTGGGMAAKEILMSKASFPEAIVCANDTMAITVCDILMKKGYRVPEDVLISGYDFTIEGQIHTPKMTSVRSCFGEVGKTACEALINRINMGTETLDGDNPGSETILLSDELVLGESFGYQSNTIRDERHSKSSCATNVLQRKYIHQTIKLEKDFMASNGYEEWLNAMKTFISQIAPTEFYLCVNDNVFELDIMEQEELSVEERLAYATNMNVILAYKNGIFKQKASFESRYAFDELFSKAENEKLYIFSPLHYLDQTFGYCVFVDSAFPERNPLFVSWLIRISASIETIRKQILVKNAMKRLDEMYIRDSLTGAYNRFGLERFFSEIKKKCMLSRSFMQLSFVDLDGLKKINDEYGHEEGDRIIIAAANVLLKRAGKFKVIRYGGDEFVVMGLTKDEQEVEDYWKSVQEEVLNYNQNMKRQAELSLSYGYEIFTVGSETYMEDCIRVTDKKMYQSKKDKKKMMV